MSERRRFTVLSYEIVVTREQMIAHQALRWFGVAPPRLCDLKMAEWQRARVMDRGYCAPLFPPPPPVLNA